MTAETLHRLHRAGFSRIIGLAGKVVQPYDQQQWLLSHWLMKMMNDNCTWCLLPLLLVGTVVSRVNWNWEKSRA